MSDLIERLEKATGPDRQLDAAISEALTGIPEKIAFEHPNFVPPRYTASIDAALTLVPGSMVSLRFQRTGQTWGCYLNGRDTNATAPAIALCIAALRARTAEEQIRDEEPDYLGIPS